MATDNTILLQDDEAKEAEFSLFTSDIKDLHEKMQTNRRSFIRTSSSENSLPCPFSEEGEERCEIRALNLNRIENSQPENRFHCLSYQPDRFILLIPFEKSLEEWKTGRMIGSEDSFRDRSKSDTSVKRRPSTNRPWKRAVSAFQQMNRTHNRRPVVLDPDPNLSTTYMYTNRSATGDQGRVEGEDISHVTSCDSDISNLGSARSLGLSSPGSQKDFASERPKEERKVNVTDKNNGGLRVYSKPDPKLSCNSKKQAEGDPILQSANKKKTLIRTSYSGVGLQIFRFPLFVIALICTSSVMSVLGNMNPVWHKEGDNAIIYFPFESHDAESREIILNVRMQSVSKPFYANGIKHDGFKDASQIRRFNVSKDGEGIKVDITAVKMEDEDIFIFTQISFHDNGSNGVSKYIQLKILTPAQCYVLSGSSRIVVHCTDAVATPGTALFCFQGNSICNAYPQPDMGDGVAEFRMKKCGEFIRCCRKAQVDPSVSISASHETCHDFIWSPTMPTTPTSTHDQDGMTTSAKGVSLDSDGGTPPYQTIPHTPSSCSRLRNVPSLIIIALVLSWFFV